MLTGSSIKKYLEQYVSAAPLAVFRICFGLLLLFSIIRFAANGWIEELYIRPSFFFPYYGFEFIVPLGRYTYLLFAVCGLSAFLVAIGLFYRAAIITLFLSFTYIELIDKTTYLNHYYFISMACLLMVFLPAQVYFSADAYRKPHLSCNRIPAWCIDSLKLLISMLYVFAGLAKIHSDWLLHALPLKIWLPAHNDVPVIGFLFNYSWVHYAFSWFGCLYDLCIPFLLWNRTTRPWAFIAVIIFHLLTAYLFPIGMFPYIMITIALIFFSAQFHEKIIGFIRRLFSVSNPFLLSDHEYRYPKKSLNFLYGVFMCFFVFQFIMPFRYLYYPGSLLWTEEGYRFSWRVMLMEKAGYTQFTVTDATGKRVVVNNMDFLTPLQEKMMSTQPDMVLQYAHMLRDHYNKNGFIHAQVYVDSYVALNGRLGKPMIAPDTDLAKERESFKHKYWILNYNE